MADPLLQAFTSEARTLLAAMDTHVRRMDRMRGMAGAQAINTCHRAIHTISGLASSLALDRILALAQGAERLLEEMRTNRLYRGATRIDALRRAVARIAELVTCLESGTEPAADDQAIIGELRRWTVVPESGLRAKPGWRANSPVPRYSIYGNQIPSGPPRRPATSPAARP